MSDHNKNAGQRTWREILENNILWVVATGGAAMVLALGFINSQVKNTAKTYLDSTAAEERIIDRHLPAIGRALVEKNVIREATDQYLKKPETQRTFKGESPSPKAVAQAIVDNHLTKITESPTVVAEINSAAMSILSTPEMKEDLRGEPASIEDVAAAVVAKHLSELTNAAIPKGAIIISDKSCNRLPGDWSTYDNASGRVILGVGTRKDDRGETRTFESGDKGGEYSHVLVKTEMPAHSHSVEDPTHAHSRDYGQLRHGQHELIPGSRADSKGDRYSTGRSATGITLGSTGGSGPHNNVQPYIALSYCVKT